MQVLKFGGTSVANAKHIEQVINIVKQAIKKDRTIVVFSAISGCTDLLIKIGQSASVQDENYLNYIDELEKRHTELIHSLIDVLYQPKIISKVNDLIDELHGVCKGVFLLRELSSVSLDLIMSFGELLSSSIISAKLISIGINNKWADARELIITHNEHAANVVESEQTTKNIQDIVSSSSIKLFVIPGFIASDTLGRTTTLGRGGSDYTASLIAVAAKARVLEIWTDVNGMMTTDPRIVPEAQTIPNISYKEALELSHFGAKVIFPPSIQPVVNKGIPIVVKNTFAPEHQGTLIETSPPESTNKLRGISFKNSIALLSMEGSGMIGIPGYSSRLFATLAQKGINIILITQASSVHTMCVAVDQKDTKLAKQAVDDTFAYEISLNKVNPLRVETGFSIITLVGDDMQNQSGTTARMIDALRHEGIRIRAIAQGSSEKNVSTVVHTEDIEDAIKSVHNEFFGLGYKQANLFVAGYGNVAKELINIIHSQKDTILKKYKTRISVAAISNSKKMLVDKNGLGLEHLCKLLKAGSDSNTDLFCEKIYNLHVKNGIFVDCTASIDTSLRYGDMLEKGISVVTANKIANSPKYAQYKELRESTSNSGASFLYETNVGAALPIISTLQQLMDSGDEIYKIEAILSGTLSYLFSTYNATKTFCEIVKEAKDLGYTEPDPRLDLAGTDLLRKTVILAREVGLQTESDEIKLTPFLPADFMEGTLEEFYAKLEAHEENIKQQYLSAQEKNKKLKFVTIIAKEGCNIELRKIESDNPLYNISGTDNAVIIYSKHYPKSLTIIGAGAGAMQTAGGLFNDILKVIR